MADYSLRVGDNDQQKKWDGLVRSAEPAAPRIGNLQSNLVSLGFSLAQTGGRNRDLPGQFGFWTSMAVRQFQAYAKLARVAADPKLAGDVFDYETVEKTGPDVYPAAEPVSGVANAKTRALIELWLKNKWRCPVVICGFSKRPAIKDGVFADIRAASGLVKATNVWVRFDAVRTARVYCSLDFANPIGSAPSIEVLGDALVPVKASRHIGGPRLDNPQVSAPDAAITPERLVGKKKPNAAEQATYKVVHAVANYEVSGRFDTVNGWDDQVLSFGPYQFAITSSGDAPITGELPSFIAMLNAGSPAEQAACKEWFGQLGLSAQPDWAQIRVNPSQRTLVSTLAFQGPMSEEQFDEKDTNPWPEVAAAKEPVRQWHLFRILVLAGRRSPVIRLGFWRFCRLRIRNLLDAPWGPAPTGYSWPASTKLKDIFRSEAAVATLLRIHVKSPKAFVFSENNVVAAREWLVKAIEGWEYADKKKSPQKWKLTEDQEASLINAILDALESKKRVAGKPSLSKKVIGQCREIVKGTATTPLGALKKTRDFELDTTGF